MDGFLEFKEELIYIIVGQKHFTVEVEEESQECKNQNDPLITTKKCYFVDLIIMVLSTFVW